MCLPLCSALCVAEDGTQGLVYVVLNVLTLDNDCEHRNDQYIRHTAAV